MKYDIINKEVKITKTNIGDYMDKKKVIILTSIIAFFIIVVFSIWSYRQILKNKELLDNDDLYLYIEQDLNASEKTLLYELKFTDDLNFDKVIESIINNGSSNRIVIENGICKVINTTCPTHSCESYVIDLDGGVFNATTITCLPNGLYISLETKR